MGIDIKHDLLTNYHYDNKMGNKGINNALDKTLVTSTAQKSLGDDLKNLEHENEDHNSNKKNKKNKNKKLVKNTNDKEKKADTIERNPLKLLRLF